MHSPLKSKNESAICVNEINKLIEIPSKINSFAFFTGELEFRLSDYGHYISAHTVNQYVYEFWEHVMTDPGRLYDVVNSPHCQFDGAEAFYSLQKTWSLETGITRAALFYILNRCSDVGGISRGCLDIEGFNYFSNRHLRDIRLPHNFELILDDDLSLDSQIKQAEPADYTMAHLGRFGYNLFDRGRLRGPEDTAVNHRKIRDVMTQDNTKMLVVYKYHPQIKTFFSDFNLIFVDACGIPCNNPETSEEIIVTNV